MPLYTAEREGYSRLYGFLEERLVGIEDIRTNGGIPHTMRDMTSDKMIVLRTDSLDTPADREPE